MTSDDRALSSSRTSKYVDFCVPVGMRPGSPSPLGATLRADDGSVNFALFSQHAEGVTLCLYEPEEAEPDVRAVGTARDAWVADA